MATETALARQPQGGWDTIYVGGGTPTALPPDAFVRMIDLVGRVATPTPPVEWSVEASPATLSREHVTAMREAGVTRVSIGVQSFDPNVLETIGRHQEPAQVEAAVALLHTAGIRNVGLDLIAGLPGVAPHVWRDDLERAVSLLPAHVSVYGLTMQPDTPLQRQLAAGVVRELEDDAMLERLRAAENALTDAGFVRYEISNYARPGYECLHNLNFWRGEDYVGIGPSAASRIGRSRQTNPADLQTYAKAVSVGETASESEVLPADADLTERFSTGFRLAEGVDVSAFCATWKVPRELQDAWRNALARLERQALVTQTRGRHALTTRGRQLANVVDEELAVYV